MTGSARDRAVEHGWIKATKSMAGGACVELRWIKASKSTDIGACVELAPDDDRIALRDSKDPDGPVLLFTPAEIDAFIDGAKRGEFDHLLTADLRAALARRAAETRP